ncbi:MAG: condensation domain-containing protein [Pseudomonadota bacterium]
MCSRYRQESSDETIGPASLGQRLLWTFERRYGHAGALSTHVVVRLRAPLDRARLEHAVRELTARHDALRAKLRWDRTKLLRIVSDSWRPEIRYLDVSASGDALAMAQQELTREITAPLVSSDWPLRCLVIGISAEDHVICLNIHHIATDWTSGEILVADLAALYSGNELPAEDGWDYSRWIEWKNSEAGTRRQARAEAYWTKVLEGATGCRIPAESHPAGEERLTAYEHGTLDPETVAGLKALVSEARVPMFCVAAAIFYAAVHAMTGQTDLTVTTISSERNRPELLRTVGYFISTVALRVRFRPEESFAELARKCRGALFGAIEHELVPIRALPAVATRQMDPGIESVVFQMVRGSSAPPAPFDNWSWRPDVGQGRTFDLEMMLQLLDGQSAQVNVLYLSRKYKPETIAALIDLYCRIADTVARAPDVPLRDLIDVARISDRAREQTSPPPVGTRDPAECA